MLVGIGTAIVLIIVVFIVILMLSHVHIHFRYRYANFVLIWELSISLFGIALRHYEGSSESGEGEKYVKSLLESALNQASLHDLYEKVNQKKCELIHILNFLQPRVKIKELYWNTAFGTGDACSTGILAGALWSAKGSVSAFVQEKYCFEKRPQIAVTPNFQGAGLQSEFDCIVAIKLGKAIRISKKYKQTLFQKQS